MNPTEALSHLVATRIDNDNVVGPLIKMGAQAAVFKGNNVTKQDDQIALKIYGPFASLSDLNEPLKHAQRQAKVKHRAIVRIDTPFGHSYDIEGQEYHFLCIPMDFSSLGTIERWPRFRDRLSAAHIDDLLLLFDGVGEIHKAGLRHCDLKPSNILLFEESGREVMRITDFGIAGDETSLGARSYGLTPEYAAPEQFANTVATPAMDVYSLGATVYQLLTGLDPFALPIDTRDRVTELERLHREAARPDAAETNPRCVARLALLLMQMMSVEPGGRPSIGVCKDSLSRIREEIVGDSSGYTPSQCQSEMLSHWPETEAFGGREGGIVLSTAAHKAFGRQLFVVQIKVPTLASVNRVFASAIHMFGDCFSIYQTYGQDDFIMLVWSSDERCTSFEERVRKEDCKVVSHRVNERTIAGFREPKVLPSRTKAIALQEDLEIAADARAHRGPRTTSARREWALKAFAFIEPRDRADRTNRIDLLSRFRDCVTQMNEEHKPVLYWFADCPNYLGAVEFVSESFDRMWSVPLQLSLLGGLTPYKTTTHLATNHFSFESDRIRL